MNHIPCQHPRQRGSEFRVPGATPAELDQEIYCAVPDCPAGFDDGISGIRLAAECPTEETGFLRPESERERMIALKRVRTAGVWRWLAMPTILGDAMVPADFPDWLTAQVFRLSVLGATAIEPQIPYKPGDVLGIKLEWEGKAMELSHPFEGIGPAWEASVRAFRSALELFPPVTAPPESEG